MLHTCSPYRFAASLTERWMRELILPTYYDPMDTINSYATCLIARPLPPESEWRAAYNDDLDTRLIMEKLSEPHPKWSHREILRVHAVYRQSTITQQRHQDPSWAPCSRQTH
ncbi:MAG: hypothetical protein ACREOZ_03300 [Gloeomargaritales cyanobacterium]